MLKFAFDTHGPFYIRLPRNYFPKIHEKTYQFLLGDPDVIKEGGDICLIGTGYGSTLSLNSAYKIE